MNTLVFLMFFIILYGADTSTLSRIHTPIDIRSESGKVYFSYELYAELPDHDPTDAGRTIVVEVKSFRRVDDNNARAVVKILEFDPSTGTREITVCKDLPPRQRCILNVKPDQRYLIEYTIVGSKIEYMKTERIHIGVFRNHRGEIDVLVFTSPVGVDLGKVIIDRINQASPDSIFLMLLFLGIFGGAMYARGMGMFAGIFDLLYPRLPTPKVVPGHRAGSINYAPAISDISKIDVAEALNTNRITVRTLDGSQQITMNSIQLDIARELGLVTRVSGTNTYYITANKLQMLKSFLNIYDRNISPYLKDEETIERLKDHYYRQQFHESLKNFIRELKNNGFNPQYTETVEHYVMFAQGQLTAAAVAKRTREEPLDSIATYAQMLANLLTSNPNPIIRGVGYLLKPALIGLVFYPYRASRGLLAIINQSIYPFKMLRRYNHPLSQITDHHHAEAAEEKIEQANEALKNLEQRNVGDSIRNVFGQNIISDNTASAINNFFSKIPKSIFDTLVFPTLGFGIAIGASIKSSTYRVVRYWYMPQVHKEIINVSPNNVASAFTNSLQALTRNISSIVLYSYIARRYPEMFQRLRDITYNNGSFNLDYDQIRNMISELETLKNDRELNDILRRIYEIQKLEIAAQYTSDFSIYAIDHRDRNAEVKSIINQLIELVDRYYEPTNNLSGQYSKHQISEGLTRLRDFLATTRYIERQNNNTTEQIAHIQLLNSKYMDYIDSHFISEYMVIQHEYLNDLGFRSIYKPMNSQQETSTTIFNDARDGFVVLVFYNMLEMHRASVMNILDRDEQGSAIEVMPNVREGFELTVLKMIGKEDVTTESHLYARLLYGKDFRKSISTMMNDGVDERIVNDVIANVILDTASNHISSDSIREGMNRWDSGTTNNDLSRYVAEMLNREFSASSNDLLNRADVIVRELIILNDIKSALGNLEDKEIIQIFEELRSNTYGKNQEQLSNYLDTSFRSSLQSRNIASDIIDGLIQNIKARFNMNIDLDSTWNSIPTNRNVDEALVKHLVQRNPSYHIPMRLGLLGPDTDQDYQIISMARRDGMRDNFNRERLAIDIIRDLTDMDPNNSFRHMGNREIFNILSDPNTFTNTFWKIPHLELLSGSYKYTQFEIGSEQILAQMHQTEYGLYFVNRNELAAATNRVAEHNPNISTAMGLLNSIRRNESMVGVKIRDLPLLYAVTKNNQIAAERVGEAARYLSSNKGVYNNSPISTKAEWMQQEVEKQLLSTSPLIENIPYAKRHFAHTLGTFIVAANYINLHQPTVQIKTSNGTTTRNNVLPSDLNIRTVHDVLKGSIRSRRFETSRSIRITTKRPVYGMGGHTVWIPELYDNLDTIIADDELLLRPKTFGVGRNNTALFRTVAKESVTDEQLISNTTQLEESISKIPSSAFEAPASAAVFILDPILGRYVHVDQDPREYGSKISNRVYYISLDVSGHFGLIMNHYNIDPIQALNAIYYGILQSNGMNMNDMMYSLHTGFFDRYHWMLTKTFIPSNAAFRNQLVSHITALTNMSQSQVNQILDQHLNRTRIPNLMNRNHEQLIPIINALYTIYNTQSLDPNLRLAAKVLYDEFQSRIYLVNHLKHLIQTNPTEISNSPVNSNEFQTALEFYVRNTNLTKSIFAHIKNSEVAGNSADYLLTISLMDSTVNDKRVLGITGIIGAINIDNYHVRNHITRGMILDTSYNIGERMENVVSELSTNIPQAFVGTISSLFTLNIPGVISNIAGGRPYYIQGITLRNRIAAAIRDIRDFMLINKALNATEYANMYFVNVEHYGHAAAMLQHAYPTIKRMFDESERVIIGNILNLMNQYENLNSNDNPNYEPMRQYIAESLIEE
ncbi:MAG: hypothetical protein NZ908_02425, partial [Candidatus Micrarchaeota archaeon]|nr:hypothetical protein [Candidatus Micrarchaeota archaeon]